MKYLRLDRNSDEYKEKQRRLSLYQKCLRKKPTLGEQIFIEKCQHFKIDYIFQKGFIAGSGFCIADFYLPKYKTVVEIDGKYHNRRKQRIRDHYKDRYYKNRNLKVLRIKEEDVESFVFDFEKPKPIYTKEQYENLKKEKQIKKQTREKKKKLEILRKKYPNS